MAEYFNSRWKEISNGLDEIYTKNDRLPPHRFMALYTCVYDICTHSFIEEGKPSNRNRRKCNDNPSECNSKILYENLVKYFENYVTRLRDGCQGLCRTELLEYYSCTWQSFHHRSINFNSIFAYLNGRIYVDSSEGKTEMLEAYNLAIYTWKEKFFVLVADDLTNAVLDTIFDQCNNEKISSSTIGSVLKSYLELDVDKEQQPRGRLDDPISFIKKRPRSLVIFKKYFENKYFEQMRLLYSAQAYYFLTHENLPEYFTELEKRFHNNKHGDDDVDKQIPDSFESMLNMFDEIHIKHERLRGVFASMIENVNIKGDDDVFHVYKTIDKYLKELESITEKYIESYVHSEFSNFVNDDEFDPRAYARSHDAIYQHYIPFLTFKENHPIINAMERMFANCINCNNINENVEIKPRISERLVRYIDLLLRKSTKNSDHEIEESLNQIIFFFKYLEDKDEFQKYYSKFLAKRLINGYSASEYFESQMLLKLQQECGFEYTNKLQRMFTDITGSKELTQLFKKEITDKNIDLPSIDFSVMILTSGFWPFRHVELCAIPSIFQNIIEKFSNFYGARHFGRKLSFLHHLCQGEIICNAFNRQYKFLASTAQMALLLKFNENLSYSLQEVIDSLEFKSKTTLFTVLQPMLNIELISLNGDKTLDANTPMDTIVSLNSYFFSKKLKINLFKTLTQNEMREDQIDVQKVLEADRRMVIQATIVRIMKMRKKLSHSALISEAIQQLSSRFKPNVLVIKKCIQELIDKEYLARVKEDHESYEYLS